jgi:hypothetical protein
MFTIESQVAETYEMAAKPAVLADFFLSAENFARYMPEIIGDVKPQTAGRATWQIRIDISGKSLSLPLEMISQKQAHKITHQPAATATGNNRLAINIAIFPETTISLVEFELLLRLERKSGSELHPMAGLLGQRAVNKIIQSFAKQYVDSFMSRAMEQLRRR